MRIKVNFCETSYKMLAYWHLQMVATIDNYIALEEADILKLIPKSRTVLLLVFMTFYYLGSGKMPNS